MSTSCLAILVLPLSAAGYTLKSTSKGSEVHWARRDIGFIVAASDTARDQQLTTAAAGALSAWSSTGLVQLGAVGPEPGAAVGYDDGGGSVIAWSNGIWQEDASALALTFLRYRIDNGEILDADVLLNDVDHQWIDAAKRKKPPQGFDLGNTLTHELGHALGLGHSELAAATMFGSSPALEITKRDLDDDDLEAIRSVYGKLPAPLVKVMDMAEPHSCQSVPMSTLALPLYLGAIAWSLRRRR